MIDPKRLARAYHRMTVTESAPDVTDEDRVGDVAAAFKYLHLAHEALARIADANDPDPQIQYTCGVAWMASGQCVQMEELLRHTFRLEHEIRARR